MTTNIDIVPSRLPMCFELKWSQTNENIFFACEVNFRSKSFTANAPFVTMKKMGGDTQFLFIDGNIKIIVFQFINIHCEPIYFQYSDFDK